jgi:hypothetical protein
MKELTQEFYPQILIYQGFLIIVILLNLYALLALVKNLNKLDRIKALICLVVSLAIPILGAIYTLGYIKKAKTH